MTILNESRRMSQSRVATTRVINNTPTPREVVRMQIHARINGYAIRTHLSPEVIRSLAPEV